MPECRYEVVDNNQQGAQVKFAKVGDKLYHKWTCRDDFLKGIAIYSGESVNWYQRIC